MKNLIQRFIWTVIAIFVFVVITHVGVTLLYHHIVFVIVVVGRCDMRTRIHALSYSTATRSRHRLLNFSSSSLSSSWEGDVPFAQWYVSFPFSSFGIVEMIDHQDYLSAAAAVAASATSSYLPVVPVGKIIFFSWCMSWVVYCRLSTTRQ